MLAPFSSYTYTLGFGGVLRLSVCPSHTSHREVEAGWNYDSCWEWFLSFVFCLVELGVCKTCVVLYFEFVFEFCGYVCVCGVNYLQIKWDWLEIYENPNKASVSHCITISSVTCSHRVAYPTRSWNAATNAPKVSALAMWGPHIWGQLYTVQLQTQHFRRHSCFCLKTPCISPMWVPDVIHVAVLVGKLEW